MTILRVYRATALVLSPNLSISTPSLFAMVTSRFPTRVSFFSIW